MVNSNNAEPYASFTDLLEAKSRLEAYYEVNFRNPAVCDRQKAASDWYAKGIAAIDDGDVDLGLDLISAAVKIQKAVLYHAYRSVAGSLILKARDNHANAPVKLSSCEEKIERAKDLYKSARRSASLRDSINYYVAALCAIEEVSGVSPVTGGKISLP